MSDEQVLFLIICFLYLTDCYLWIDKHSFAFVLSWGETWKLGFSNPFIGNKRGGCLFINPLYPYLSKVFQCHLFPVSFSPIGVCAYNSQTLSSIGKPPQSGILFKYDDINNVRVNYKEVYINDTIFIKCKTIKHAELIYKVLRIVITLPIAERDYSITENILSLLQYREAHKIFNYYNSQSVALRTFTSLMFIKLFFISPYLVWTFGLTQTIIPIAIFMYILAVQISINFYRIHKYFYPSEKYDRINNIAKMILCPPTAIRANDILTSNLISYCDPLSLAFIFFDKQHFTDFAKKLIRDLKYSIKTDLCDEYSESINLWYRTNLIKIYMDYFRDYFDIETDFFGAPKPFDIKSKTYCPRCLCQFINDNHECPDCNGVRLIPFDETSGD